MKLHFRVGVAAALAATVVVGGFGAGLGPALAADSPPDQTVVVDAAQQLGAPSGVGRGFLYGLSTDGSQPSDELLQPLEPTSFRSGGEIDEPGSFGWGAGQEQFPPRYEAMRAQATRVTNAPYDATFDVILSDLWGSDGSGIRPKDLEEPCDDGPACANWVAFLTETIDRMRDDGLLKPAVRLDIWNEPAANSYFWPRSQEQYYQMWNAGVQTLRALYPEGLIVGPSTANFHGPTQEMYLDQAVAAGTLPDIWNWHFSTDPVADEIEMRGLLAERGITDMPMSINEYLFAPEQNAGHAAWYLARLQRSGIESASHAIWSNCCGSGLLDGLLLPSPGGTATTGAYWVYEASAAADGVVVQSEPSDDVDLLATRDDSAHRISVLLGSRDFTGELSTRVTGLDSSAIGGAGAVTVLVQRLAEGRLDAPVTVSNTIQPVVDGAVDIRIPWQLSTDAYTVQVLPAFAGAAAVDADETGTSVGQFAYGPDWETETGAAGMFGGTANRSAEPGQLATYTFTGTSAQLYALRDADQGIMAVSIDGGRPVEVDGYAAQRSPSALVWESGALQPGAHVIAVSATGERNPASSGTTVTLDRVDVPRVVASIDADQRGPGPDRFGYGEGWGVAHGIADMFAGTANWSSGADQTATFSFSGRQAWLYAVRDTDQGIMEVSIDGGDPTTVDNYAPAREPSARVWQSALLTPGEHTVTIRATGQANAASSGSNVALDRAEFDQKNPEFTVDADVKGSEQNQVDYSAGWGSTGGVGDMYSGTANWSPIAGSTATFRFQGSRAVLHAVRDVDQGILSASIDGGTPVRVDDYSAVRDGSAAVWDSGDLAFGAHTLVVTVTGDRNPSARGATIALDSIDVTADETGIAATVPMVSDVTVTVPAGASDVLVPPLFASGVPDSLSVETAPDNGSATAEGVTLRFRAAEGWSGTETFRYTATNAVGTSAPASVTVVVEAAATPTPTPTATPTATPSPTPTTDPTESTPVPGGSTTGGDSSEPAAVGANQSAQLAATGSADVVMFLLAGGLLLALGGTVLAARRRRRS